MDLPSYIEHHQKTHLIFDFDETIFRLILPWEDCLLYAEKDLKKLDSALFAIYENGIFRWSELQNEFIKKHGEVAKEIFLANNTKFESDMLEGVDTNPELINFINTSPLTHFFIWSSNTKPVIESVLKQFDIHHRFEKIITRNDVLMLKPNPEGFQYIYDTLVSKENYLMIGDSSADREAAQAAGIDFFPVFYF